MKRKRIIIITLISIAVLILAAYAAMIEDLESLGHHIMLNADTPPSVYTDLVITEIDTDHIVLSGIGCIADTYRVPNWFHPSIVPQVGDIVTVHHNGGERGEIYPAEFDKIYGMTIKTSEGADITVIPAMRGN